MPGRERREQKRNKMENTNIKRVEGLLWMKRHTPEGSETRGGPVLEHRKKRIRGKERQGESAVS